jgi:replicative DNA helicase
MRGLYDRLKNKVDRGRQGLSYGIPTRLKKLDYFTTGIQQGNYWVIGAETNVGKTAFVRDQFIYQPFNYWLKNRDKFNIKFIDFSLEMTAEDNLANFVVKDIYKDHKKVVSRSVLMSQGRTKDGAERKLNDEIYEMFIAQEERIKEFEKHITIVDSEVTPGFYHDLLFEYAKANGTFENPDVKFIGKAGKYTPNDPTLLTIVIIDTINLADCEPNQTVKQTIDRISRINVWFRNVCRFTPIVIQQFNADISGTDRSRYGIKTPLLRDFEDSKRPTKDADIVLGLFDPTRHDMEECAGHNVTILQNWFRSVHLLKNRNGEMNISEGLLFKGAVGMFEELPDPGVFKGNLELYKRIMTY